MTLKSSAVALGAVLWIASMAQVPVAAQRGRGRGFAPAQTQPQTGRAMAPVDLTGYWVSLVTEDWRWRMVTPAKGDYQGVPLSAAGRKVADAWDPSTDGSCQAYGAAGLMRMPGRLHITWQDDDTLKVETDAGEQTRLLHFGTADPPAGRSLQGYSSAQWVIGGRGRGRGGFGGLGGGGGGVSWAPLRVVTTNLSGGWLRRNGVPYSPQAMLKENFLLLSEDPDDLDNAQHLTIVTTVEDPMYLNGSFITSTNFKREPDGAKWSPMPCRELGSR